MLIVALRFMSSLCYVAFAFNRIALIGKDHNKLVETITNANMKTYVTVSGLISVALSIVKAFKYRVNYDHAELNYPFVIESDLSQDRGWRRDAYLVTNAISDMLNYVVFVLVNVGIDAYMLVRLRRTLNEKLSRFEDEQKNNKTQGEVTKAMNNAIRMVVANSAFNFCLKFPLVFMSLQNVIAVFYYKSDGFQNGLNTQFDAYFYILINIDFVNLIPQMAEFFYNLLIAVQLFVLMRFDKKLKQAFDLVFPSSQNTTNNTTVFL